MSIRRSSLFLQYDENGNPYWQMDDDPEGSYVLYADHVAEMERMAARYLIADREQQQGEDLAYKAAIQAAVWAIEELPCKCNDGADYCDGHTDAINAIDALKEKTDE